MIKNIANQIGETIMVVVLQTNMVVAQVILQIEENLTVVVGILTLTIRECIREQETVRSTFIVMVMVMVIMVYI